MNEEAAKQLRAAFKPEQIGKLPRVTCGNCRDAPSKVCQQHQKGRCDDCGAWISSAHIHLDYVGHAATTDRLLEVDPEWGWEPMAYADDGGPMIRTRGKTASLWIRLTIAGTTRPGVGTADSAKPDAEKELIGDALRNAAMRFGVALDLWSKEDLHAAEDDGTASKPNVAPEEGAPTSAGNTRAGPRVLEGWASYDEQHAAHEAYVERAKAAPEDVQEAIKEWRKAQGYGYPMTVVELEATNGELARLLVGTPGVENLDHCPGCDALLTEKNVMVDLESCQRCAPM